MSDSIQTLKNGVANLLFIIRDNDDNDILISSIYENEEPTSINSYVKSFSYRYDEENDDKCTIKLQFEQASQLDNVIFKADTILKVNWGYTEVGGSVLKSPQRKIAIRDIKSTYNSNGILLTLECTDLVAYLSKVRSQAKSDSNNFADWLKEIVNDDFNAFVRIKNRTLLIEKDRESSWEKDAEGKNVQLDNARVLKSNFINLPDKLMGGKSKSIKAELLERMNGSEAGPAYLDGRDGNINIRVRNYDQAPWTSYTISGGFHEVVSFTSSSNISATKDDGAKTSTVNPKTKSVETTDIVAAIPDANEPALTPEQLEWVQQGLVEIWEHNILYPDDQKAVEDITYNWYRQEEETKTEMRKVRTAGGIALPGVSTIISKEVKVTTPRRPKRITVAAKTIINSPAFASKQKEVIARNYIVRKVENKFQAQIEVLGDPSLVTSKIYEFLGLSKKDSGSWYAVSIEHILTDRGYVCKLKCVRKPVLLGMQYLKRNIKTRTVENEIRLKTEKEYVPAPLYSLPETKEQIDEKARLLQEEKVRRNTEFNERIKLLESEDDIPNNIDNTELNDVNPNTEDV